MLLSGAHWSVPNYNNDRCVNHLLRLVSREWKKKTQTFDEHSKLHVFHVSGLKILLEREEKHKKKLVVFIQTAARVAEHLVRQILNHVVQSLRSEWRLLRPAQKLIDYSSVHPRENDARCVIEISGGYRLKLCIM